MLVDKYDGGGGRWSGVMEQCVAEGHAGSASADHEVVARWDITSGLVGGADLLLRWRFVGRHCSCFFGKNELGTAKRGATVRRFFAKMDGSEGRPTCKPDITNARMYDKSNRQVELRVYNKRICR